MINEFHASLLNSVARNNEPGFDFVPREWQPRVCSTSANAVRQALLVQSRDAAAANWRSAEIRRIIAGSDLSNLMLKFDRRDGYASGDRLQEMAKFLQPQISADVLADKVSFNQRLKADAYYIYRWHISVSGGTCTVRYGNKTETVSVSLSPFTLVTLPESTITCEFPSTDNSIFIAWASKPTRTISDTANQLRVNMQSAVNDLANEPSLLDDNERRLLRNVILYNGEAPAQVGAAAILLAGSTLTAPISDLLNVDSTYASVG